MKPLTLLLASFIILCTSALAQDILITSKGDTLKGKARIMVNGVDKRVQITTEQKKKLSYTILQVKSVDIDSERYQPVKFGNTYTFMKLLKKGYLSLYAFKPEQQNTYDGRYMVKPDGYGMEVPNIAFKKSISKFLKECPQLIEKIDNGELGRNDVNKIIDTYNAYIAANTQAANQVIAEASVIEKSADKVHTWETLEQKVKASDLASKNDALEMIVEIKEKIKKGDKVPNFLTEGLKNTLSPSPELTTLFETALKEL